jgi:hypothetical protein
MSGPSHRPGQPPSLDQAKQSRLAHCGFAVSIFAGPLHGAFVYRLGHGPLKAGRRVRFPYALPLSPAEIRRQPFLDVIHADVLPRRIVADLIVGDRSDAEILRVRVGKIKAAHARSRMHGKRFS